MAKIVLCFLLWGSVQDIKSEHISVAYLIIFFLCTFVGGAFSENISFLTIAGGFLIGCSCILLSVASQGRLGKGDGCVIGITGMYLGLPRAGLWFGVSLLISGIFALLLLVIYKDNKKSFPFLPFLFLGGIYIERLGFF